MPKMTIGGVPITPHAICPECGRVFNLMNEDDASEYYYGHDCEAPESPPKPLDRPPRMTRNRNGGWTCQDCGFLVILFDDDEHDCDVTGTSSNVNPANDNDEEG